MDPYRICTSYSQPSGSLSLWLLNHESPTWDKDGDLFESVNMKKKQDRYIYMEKGQHLLHLGPI